MFMTKADLLWSLKIQGTAFLLTAEFMVIYFGIKSLIEG